MKLNFNSNTSFKSIPIYDVKVKQKVNGEEKFVDATFSELTYSDIPALRKLPSSWYKNPYASFVICDLIEGYQGDAFAIELKGDEPLERRLLSIAEIDENQLTFLQSKPRSKSKVQYKGAGAMMMYGIIRQQNEAKTPMFYWTADTNATGFYNHIGDNLFEVEDKKDFCIYKNNYPAFLEKMEKEYQFDIEA